MPEMCFTYLFGAFPPIPGDYGGCPPCAPLTSLPPMTLHLWKFPPFITLSICVGPGFQSIILCRECSRTKVKHSLSSCVLSQTLSCAIWMRVDEQHERKDLDCAAVLCDVLLLPAPRRYPSLQIYSHSVFPKLRKNRKTHSNRCYKPKLKPSYSYFARFFLVCLLYSHMQSPLD